MPAPGKAVVALIRPLAGTAPSFVVGLLSNTTVVPDTPLLPSAKPSLVCEVPPQIEVSPKEASPNHGMSRWMPNWTSQALYSGGLLPLNAPIAFESLLSLMLKAVNTKSPVGTCLIDADTAPFVDVALKTSQSAAG